MTTADDQEDDAREEMGLGSAFCHWCGPGVPADDTDSYGRDVCHACAMHDDGEGPDG